MSEWSSLSVGDIFPTDISDIVANARSVIDSVAEIIGKFGQAAELSGLLITEYVDPIKAITESIIAEIEAFIEDYFKAGVYVLGIPPGPPGRGFRQSTDQFLSVLENSFYDSADPNIPIYASSSFAAVILLVGAPSLEELIDSANGLGELFDISTLKIKGTIKKLLDSGILSASLVASVVPQNVSISGDISLFPDSGVLRIGDEITTYTGKKEDGLSGVIIRREHEEGEEVSVVTVNTAPVGTTTSLSSDVSGNGLESEIFVDSTFGFPSSGSIFVGSEELEYEGKTSTSFLKTFPKEDHPSGVSVTLGKGSSFHGSPPDWENIVMLQVFSEFNVMIQEVANLSAMLYGATSIGESLSEFGSMITDKADRLRRKLDKILSKMEEFASLLDISGVNILTVTGSGSIEDFIDSIKSADGKPEFDESSYTAGVVLVSSTENSSALLNLFGL